MTSVKYKRNKPDIIIWDRETKLCTALGISSPADISVKQKIREKENIYVEVSKIISARGYITHYPNTDIEKLVFSRREMRMLIRRIQTQSIIGTVKIYETFEKFII